MPHRPSPLAVALCVVLTAPFARAQSAPAAPLRLTLAEALRRAAEDPPAVRVALARAAAAQAQIDVARSAYYPSLSVSGSASINYRNFANRTTGLVIGGRQVDQETSGDSTTFGANAALNGQVNIWDFGRTSNAVDASEHGSRAARSDTDSARIQAMGAVASTYLTVLSDQEAIAAAQATLTQREAHLRIADGLVTAGARPPIERVRAQVNLDVARLDLTRTEGRALNDRAALAAALGVDPLQELTLAPADEGALTVDDDPARASAAAVQARPELASLRHRLAQAEAQAAGARANLAPALSAQASAAIAYNTILGTGVGQSGNSESVQGGVSLSWPAFDPTVRANIRASEANIATARANLAQQSLQVRSAATQAAMSARIARLALEQAERLAVSAAANLEQATGRYQSGAAPLLEIIDAQAADASARAQVITARLAWQTARVNLLVATGELARMAR
jgi:multidrug efflux system outer membrane protein